jgi:hypothetical protein
MVFLGTVERCSPAETFIEDLDAGARRFAQRHPGANAHTAKARDFEPMRVLVAEGTSWFLATVGGVRFRRDRLASHNGHIRIRKRLK